VQSRLRELERSVQRLQAELATERASQALTDAVSVDGMKVVSLEVEAPSVEVLRTIGDRLRERIGSGVVILGSAIEGRPTLLAMATRDAVRRGANAGDVIRAAAPLIGGRGGGRPEIAQGGGVDVNQLRAALRVARDEAVRQLQLTQTG